MTLALETNPVKLLQLRAAPKPVRAKLGCKPSTTAKSLGRAGSENWDILGPCIGPVHFHEPGIKILGRFFVVSHDQTCSTFGWGSLMSDSIRLTLRSRNVLLGAAVGQPPQDRMIRPARNSDLRSKSEAIHATAAFSVEYAYEA